MCATGPISSGNIVALKSGDLAVVQDDDKSAVIVSGAAAGTLVKYKSSMGHVLCEGSEDESEQDKCELHPLDVSHHEKGLHGLVDDALRNAARTLPRTVTVEAPKPAPKSKRKPAKRRA